MVVAALLLWNESISMVLHLRRAWSLEGGGIERYTFIHSHADVDIYPTGVSVRHRSTICDPSWRADGTPPPSNLQPIITNRDAIVLLPVWSRGDRIQHNRASKVAPRSPIQVSR